MIDRLVLGGVEKTAIEEVRCLRESGIDANLLVLKRDGSIPAAFRQRLTEIPFEFLDDRLPRFLRTSWRIPGFYFFSVFHLLYAATLPWRVKRTEWEMILSHNSYTTFTAWMIARLRGIPYSMYVWDPVESVIVRAYTRGPIRLFKAVLLPIATLVDRVLARGARQVFLSSHSYEGYMRRLLPAGATLAIVPPGCHPTDKPRPNAGGHLLAATSWKEGKSLEVLLRALSQVPEARLLIAGRWLHPGYRARMEALIGELGLAKRIEFEGEYDEARMAELARDALCIVTMNAELGFGMPSLEAAAQACTFVCPGVAGVAAYFTEGVEAYYYTEGDPAGLAAVLRHLVAEPGRAYAAGIAAWERARSSLTWRHHATAIAQVMGIPAPAQSTR